jgi:4-carboxymuconolactone decarboxylase
MAYTDELLGLALHDESFLLPLLTAGHSTPPESCLDPKTHLLVRLSALLALDAAPASYVSIVTAATEAGATIEEIVDTLLAVVNVIGIARTVSAASELALAVGFDIDHAIEDVHATS